MIVLTKQDCINARFVVEDAAAHKELDAPVVSVLLGAISDALETIKIERTRIVLLDA